MTNKIISVNLVCFYVLLMQIKATSSTGQQVTGSDTRQEDLHNTALFIIIFSIWLDDKIV